MLRDLEVGAREFDVMYRNIVGSGVLGGDAGAPVVDAQADIAIMQKSPGPDDPTSDPTGTYSWIGQVRYTGPSLFSGSIDWTLYLWGSGDKRFVIFFDYNTGAISSDAYVTISATAQGTPAVLGHPDGINFVSTGSPQAGIAIVAGQFVFDKPIDLTGNNNPIVGIDAASAVALADYA